MASIPHAISSLLTIAQTDSPDAKLALNKLRNHKIPKAVKLALEANGLKFDKDKNIVDKSNHGGVREGSGRKALRGPTKVMRIPELYQEAINSLMEHLDDHQQSPTSYNSGFNVNTIANRLIKIEIKSTKPN
ncbi:MAG: hypothetical protein ACI95X_002932 [Paraglaciecola sp.]|jgi:hypothetical protein